MSKLAGGCVRLTNADVTDLYSRVTVSTGVMSPTVSPYSRLAIALFTMHPQLLRQGERPLVRAAEKRRRAGSPCLSSFWQQSFDRRDYSQK
jgi:hypothetical protein